MKSRINVGAFLFWAFGFAIGHFPVSPHKDSSARRWSRSRHRLVAGDHQPTFELKSNPQTRAGRSPAEVQ